MRSGVQIFDRFWELIKRKEINGYNNNWTLSGLVGFLSRWKSLPRTQPLYSNFRSFSSCTDLANDLQRMTFYRSCEWPSTDHANDLQLTLRVIYTELDLIVEILLFRYSKDGSTCKISNSVGDLAQKLSLLEKKRWTEQTQWLRYGIPYWTDSPSVGVRSIWWSEHFFVQKRLIGIWLSSHCQ